MRFGPSGTAIAVNPKIFHINEKSTVVGRDNRR
jgi:hypothetical protein